MKVFSKVYMALVMIFLYAPIVVMIIFSFNSSKSTAVFAGFSTKWYAELVHDSATLEALKNTIVLAVSSSVISVIIGTAAAIGIYGLRKKWLKTTILSVTNIPMINPEIVTGVSMMLLFVFIGRLVSVKDVLGFETLLIAHITFNLPYVILSVLPVLKQTDPHIPEAAQDLGCTPLQALFKVTLPAIRPGIVTGFLMAFTLSLDDFIISYFSSGPEFQTLPIRIFSMTKKRVTPDMYALSSLIFVAILILLLVMNFSQSRAENKNKKSKKG